MFSGSQISPDEEDWQAVDGYGVCVDGQGGVDLHAECFDDAVTLHGWSGPFARVAPPLGPPGVERTC